MLPPETQTTSCAASSAAGSATSRTKRRSTLGCQPSSAHALVERELAQRVVADGGQQEAGPRAGAGRDAREARELGGEQRAVARVEQPAAAEADDRRRRRAHTGLPPRIVGLWRAKRSSRSSSSRARAIAGRAPTRAKCACTASPPIGKSGM